MEQELQLWDDTRSQVIQFYLAKTFRRGNQHKTKLLYHFRIGQINPETKSLKPVMEVLNRESHLEDWDILSRKIRDIILARSEDAQFKPREKDIELSLERILATPQIETKLAIDGVAYLAQTPEITGHMGIDIKFWTTIELLKKFQMQLHQILQNRDFRSNVEILPELPVSGLGEEEETEKSSDSAEESEDADDNDVVKKAQPNTEMMMKVEDSLETDDEESVEVEDWEAEDVEELGGDDLDNSKDDEDEKTDEPVNEEVKQEESEPEETSKEEKIEEPEKVEKAEEKPEQEKTEEKVEEEKPKPKRRGRKPKAEKKDDEADDKKEDKPKKTTKAKTTAKKTTAKKTPGRKPRKTKKDDEKKEEVKEEKPAEKAEEKKDE